MPPMMPDHAPANVDQLLAQAQSELHVGQLQSARSRVQAVLSREPGHLQARLMAANVALAAGELDPAINGLQLLCQELGQPEPLRRGLASALNARGCRRRREGAEAAALEDFVAALTAAPGHPEAGFNRVLSLLALNRNAEAETALDAHLRAHPGDLEAALQRALLRPASPEREAEVAGLLSQPASAQLPVELRLRAAVACGAAEIGLAALAEAPAASKLHWSWELGERLRFDNLAQAARRAHAAALEVETPPLRAALSAALSGCWIQPSSASEAAESQRRRAALDDLEQAWPDLIKRADPALDALAHTPFLLAYQDDAPHALHARTATLIESAAVHHHPQLAQAVRCRHPRRVLLVGSIFRDCTAGAYFGGWIGWLQQAGFEVVIYQLGPSRDAESKRLGAIANRFHFINAETPLETLAQRLREEQAALLLYPELGMDARLLALASLRLAARQAAAWGHPVSPGFASLDAYFSCAEMEPASADAHYLEPLRLLPGLGVDYRRPPLPMPASRAELGLPEQGPLLLVPQSMFKLRCDNDAVYAELLQRLPNARLVLFTDRAAWQQALITRFAAAGIDAARVHWLPQCDRARYLQINAACDLMLDSLHFSGGNASLDALQAGLPVLTSPGRMMRGRQSAAMLTRLGLADALVAETPEALAARGAELLQSDALPELRARIAAALPVLFETEQAHARFIEHIEDLCAQGATA
jgi:predicted O-linked N-acetylglucosamine transferase (SPINDLY family)